MSKSVNGSFDELVAGISAEERKILLEKLNTNKESILPVLHPQKIIEYKPLEITLRAEPFLYRLFLWIKSFFQKKQVSELYNDDLISDLARKLNKAHSGTVLHSHKLIQSTFYERIKSLKNAQDFFAPYFSYINENLSNFYVFLSLFITPKISEQISNEVDPYSLPDEAKGNLETRNSLLKNLTNLLNNLNSEEKNSLYEGILSLTWLNQFSKLPFFHLIAQFTTIISDNFTCPYANARVDFEMIAKIMGNATPISNEILEAIFLFPYRTSSNGINIDSETERALSEFLTKSAIHLASINSFIQAIPVTAFGKIINNDYQWQPKNFGGNEDWFIKFKEEWKKIFAKRWTIWLQDKKKDELKTLLKTEFKIDQFPELKYQPWKSLWGGINFHCEMTAGFLCWYIEERFEKTILPYNAIVTEAIFINQENRNEFSQYFNEIQDVSYTITNFIESLTPSGEIGSVFETIEKEHSRAIKNQNKINKIILNAESLIKNSETKFCICCDNLERIINSCIGEQKIPGYEPIQNFNQIQGRENQQFKEDLSNSRKEFIICKSIFAEIEPLDLPGTSNSK